MSTIVKSIHVTLLINDKWTFSAKWQCSQIVLRPSLGEQITIVDR